MHYNMILHSEQCFNLIASDFYLKNVPCHLFPEPSMMIIFTLPAMQGEHLILLIASTYILEDDQITHRFYLYLTAECTSDGVPMYAFFTNHLIQFLIAFEHVIIT